MTITTLILLILFSLIALILIVALFVRKHHNVQRDIVINVPVQQVFDYVKLLKNWGNFNKWAAADPKIKEEYTGKDGTVGFTIAWSGNKNAGQGEKEIKSLLDAQSMTYEMRFVKPMKVTSYVTITTTQLSANHTNVAWKNSGRLPYPFNLMVPMMEKKLPKDMDESLANLKAILENSRG
jgi:hypothetical protein